MLLWDVLARSSAVLVIAALTNAALRGRSAALRHAVWACGLAGALAVAPLSWILPTWHVPLVPAFATATATPTPMPMPAPLTATVTPTTGAAPVDAAPPSPALEMDLRASVPPPAPPAVDDSVGIRPRAA